MAQTGLQLPYGIQPVNPVPVDAWSGPYSGASEAAAVSLANSSIPQPVRFQTMEVRLIVGGSAKKYWYRDGVSDSDLVELTTGTTQTTQTTSSVVWQFMEAPTGATDDSNVTFVLANSPSPANSLMLFVNGVLQMQGSNFDYTLSGATVTMTQPVLAGSKLMATYSYLQAGSAIAWMEAVGGVVDGVNVDFTLTRPPSPPGSLMLFCNGVLQSQGDDYTLSGNAIELYRTPLPGANLLATYTY